MRSKTNQVIILKNFTSPEIQQAIIILKNPFTENESRIVAEAEEVIDRYLEKRRLESASGRRAGGVLACVVGAGLCIAALAVYGAVQLIGTIM